MRRNALLVLGIFVAAPVPSAAQPGSGADTLPAAIAAAARSFMQEGRIPGLAVGVQRGERVVFAGGFGVTRVGGDTAVTERTIFHMASVTKPFVATAIVQLVEQGKVSVDSPVVRYLPEFRMQSPDARSITLRQVLNHTAGLPDVTNYAWDQPEYDDGALERYVRGLADSSLAAPPGSVWDYSNIGFELLAHVAATVSGESFEDYVQRHILTPLGMRKSTLLMTDVDSTLLAWGHVHRGTEVAPARAYPYNRRHAGSSTLHSNVVDMLRWASANLRRGELDGRRILADSSYDDLWTATRDMTADLQARYARAGLTPPWQRYAIGLSWFLLTDKGRQLVNHSGGDLGFRSDLYLVPAESLAVVVMANDQSADVAKLAKTILGLVSGRP